MPSVSRNSAQRSLHHNESLSTIRTPSHHLNDGTTQLVKGLWKALSRTTIPYLDKETLASLGVSVGDLSFTKGQTHDGSDQCIQPIPLEEIDQAFGPDPALEG